MWSGNAHTGDSYPNQWGMNSAAYMSMPHEQVDWASLAQQWIKMKEEGGSSGKPIGEGIMDCQKEDSNSNPPPPPPPPPSLSSPSVPLTPAAPSSWSSNQTEGVWNGSWGWEQNSNWWMGSAPPVDQKAPPAAPSFNTTSYTPIVEPTPPVTSTPTVFPYSAPTPPAPVPPQFTPAPQTYWPPASSSPQDVKESPTWDHQRSARKHSSHQSEPPPELDAARRKQLPAWIREGLEKMEREKQKKAESEKMALEKKTTPSRPLWESEALDDTHVSSDHNGTIEVHTVPSKFDSDSEDSNHAKVVDASDDKSANKIKKSRFNFSERESPPPPTPPPPPPKPVFKSKEQIFETVMVDVRRILTQILMEVTDEEIRKCAEQVVHHAIQKAPATMGRKSQALTSLTGKLGLGIYESESESEEDSDQEKVTNEAESDEEILNRIQRLQSDFVSVEKNIDREAKIQEEREKRQLGKKEGSGDESSDDPEEQVQPHHQGGSSENKTERRASSAHSDDKHHHHAHHHQHSDHHTHVDHEPVQSKNSSDSRERSEERSSKEASRSSHRSSEHKSRRYSSDSSSDSSSSSRSSRSSYRRRKYRSTKSSKYRYSHSRSRSRSRSRDTNHSRDSRRSSRRERRHSDSCKKRRSPERRKRRRSSSSSSGGRYKRSNHRRY